MSTVRLGLVGPRRRMLFGVALSRIALCGGALCVSFVIAGALNRVGAQPVETVQAMQAVQPARTLRSAMSARVNARVHDRAAEDEIGAWHLDRCLLGLSYGAPLKLNAGIGGGLRRAGASRTVCAFTALQLGFGGARTSVGAATTIGRYGSGVGVSGGVLRTFGSPLGAESWSNYAGGSLHMWPVIGLHTEVGWYRPIGVNIDGRENVFAWSVGFGL